MKQQPEAHIKQSEGAEKRNHTAQQLHIVHVMIDGFVHNTLGVLPDALHAPARGAAPVVFARQLWLYLFHANLGGSISATAAAVGRDRRMVAHALGRIEALRDEDATFDRLLDVYVLDSGRLVRNGLLRHGLRLGLEATPFVPRRQDFHDQAGTHPHA